ncbi:hypothetical protein UFOVP1299_49 [uncultured Caudovirales phage]|uniref:Uncharacterized protein n=1 Tax=uncultured Caudovirales phage TaxID=2100421 RepID=A0A6J5RFH2_9CAUD|nr:hypothetical protein UFOVP1299_49 [uncultured Caudovirales phage]
MTTSLAGSLKVALSTTLTNTSDLEVVNSLLGNTTTFTVTNGTGANQSNMQFSDTRTTDVSGETLDLAGVLLNAFGVAITFTAIHAIIIKAAAANTLDVVVGNAVATQFVGPFGAATHTMAVGPGQMWMITNFSAAGWACTGGSLDNLLIKASNTGNVTYDIILIGEV